MNSGDLTSDALKYKGYVMDFVLEFGSKLIGAVVVLIIGLWVIKAITKASDQIGRASCRERVSSPG